MWQSHLAEPHASGVGKGPVIGHAVSADLVLWERQPIALWNDQQFDSVAVFTGSATMVDGSPVLVYPGICSEVDYPACAGYNIVLALAVPENRSDARLTRWKKTGVIVNNTQRDPSSAWRAGSEWRFTNYDGDVFSSIDFAVWRLAGHLFQEGECPDFYQIPPFCDGEGCAGPAPPGPPPTHVHKISNGGQDFYFLGQYLNGSAGSTGAWVPSPSAPSKGQPLDGSGIAYVGKPHTGPYYASKSFFDDAHGRRITWAWVGQSQSLPRVTTYHAALQMLIFSPLPELAKLRVQPPLFEQSTVTIDAGSHLWLSTGWPAGAGNTSEFGATFILPAERAVFGVSVGADNADGTGNAFPITIVWDPMTRTANVTTRNPPDAFAPLPILATETSIELRVFFDNTVFEAFFAGGRRAFTHVVPAVNASSVSGVFLFANVSVRAVNVTAWAMASAWL